MKDPFCYSGNSCFLVMVLFVYVCAGMMLCVLGWDVCSKDHTWSSIMTCSYLDLPKMWNSQKNKPQQLVLLPHLKKKEILGQVISKVHGNVFHLLAE